ncbi:spermidine/putrescine ABC transporter substrate-binding protein [Halomonas sp. McH1-25]|uniref:ABC transporter substrate-binding protein n=1 Tax=unclassified Halomonas TaxID=2609666 RepID=UPI001EF72411|nr:MULTISPECIES: spermidine/putrescine ABC transporter substrate-binding protein [unclassified Halomonas]MCG7599019.1 spermidine/putrescine ABC transporter substrate-binding protein [Halomonas sp. McH1-25]MCP1343734.1 spermidine/putrescine ABC transporter substrate-binding protein [Halomonas sp. FL8]MCP1360334.1 spermidine/putrescine ABC transporter substrate-binding protein [Halomonas sp. BBD45]
MSHRPLLVAVGLGLSILAMPVAAQQQLNLFNWSDYMDPALIEAFEEETGIEVVLNYYNSNAEMFSKLTAGGDAQYDVIVPSGYFMPRLIGAGLVQPLTAEGEPLPGREAILDEFQTPDYDPEGRYTVPYLWGMTGIAYNTETWPDPEPSWALLYDPEVNDAQPFALLKGDAQFTFGTACAYLGYGFDCVGKEPWIEAAKLISETRQRDNFVGFVDATATIEQLARGTIQAGVAYNGDLANKLAESSETYGKIGFFIPEEGSQRWVDVLAIPARAPHPEAARAFVEYMLRPDVAAQLANYNRYTTPNKEALALVDPALREPPVMPDAQTRQRLVSTPSVSGDTLQLLQQLWNEALSR